MSKTLEKVFLLFLRNKVDKEQLGKIQHFRPDVVSRSMQKKDIVVD